MSRIGSNLIGMGEENLLDQARGRLFLFLFFFFFFAVPASGEGLDCMHLKAKGKRVLEISSLGIKLQ